MDQQLLISTVISFLVAATGWLKSHTEVLSVKRDREATKVERDSRISVLETKVNELEHRLDAGNERFDRIEKELKETNGMLRELLGMFKMTVPPIKTFDDVVRREG